MHACMSSMNIYKHECVTCIYFCLQVPQEIPFGDPFYTDQFSGLKRRKVRQRDCFYYIPLLETLSTLLNITEVQAEVVTPRSTETHELSDFCDGELFKTHPLFSTEKNALQIIAYYDEMEVVNPILAPMYLNIS